LCLARKKSTPGCWDGLRPEDFGPPESGVDRRATVSGSSMGICLVVERERSGDAVMMTLDVGGCVPSRPPLPRPLHIAWETLEGHDTVKAVRAAVRSGSTMSIFFWADRRKVHWLVGVASSGPSKVDPHRVQDRLFGRVGLVEWGNLDVMAAWLRRTRLENRGPDSGRI